MGLDGAGHGATNIGALEIRSKNGAQMRRTTNGISDSHAPIKPQGHSDPSKLIGFRNIWMRPPH
jgi:hypothetical protein